MKTLLFSMILVVMAAFLVNCGSERSFFAETPAFYSANKNATGHAPVAKLRDWHDGYYALEICTQWATVEGENINWFCDCNELEVEARKPIDRIGMIFIDEARVLFLRNPEDRLNRLDIKGGFKDPFWQGTYLFTDSAQGIPGKLRVRFRPYSNDGKFDNYRELFFDIGDKGESLSLTKFKYFEVESPLDTTDLKGNRDNLAMKSIRPEDVFCLKEVKYQLRDGKPFQLFVGAKPVESIQYLEKNGVLCRSYFSKGEEVLCEPLDQPGGIETW